MSSLIVTAKMNGVDPQAGWPMFLPASPLTQLIDWTNFCLGIGRRHQRLLRKRRDLRADDAPARRLTCLWPTPDAYTASHETKGATPTVCGRDNSCVLDLAGAAPRPVRYKRDLARDVGASRALGMRAPSARPRYPRINASALNSVLDYVTPRVALCVKLKDPSRLLVSGVRAVEMMRH